MKTKMTVLATLALLCAGSTIATAGLFDSIPTVESLKEKAMQETKDAVATETKSRQEEAVATVKDKAKNSAKEAGRSLSSKKAGEPKTQD